MEIIFPLDELVNHEILINNCKMIKDDIERFIDSEKLVKKNIFK